MPSPTPDTVSEPLASSENDLVYVTYYRSIASSSLRHVDLARLLSTSAAANAQIGITGFLVYADVPVQVPGQFAQWLEGPEAAVKRLYEKITRDRRHTHCEVLGEGLATELIGRNARLFPDWSMTLERLVDLPLTLKAYRRLACDYGPDPMSEPHAGG